VEIGDILLFVPIFPGAAVGRTGKNRHEKENVPYFPFFASASTTRLMFHCCAMESSVLVSQ
jgi:hypothetical protein